MRHHRIDSTGDRYILESKNVGCRVVKNGSANVVELGKCFIIGRSNACASHFDVVVGKFLRLDNHLVLYQLSVQCYASETCVEASTLRLHNGTAVERERLYAAHTGVGVSLCPDRSVVDGDFGSCEFVSDRAFAFNSAVIDGQRGVGRNVEPEVLAREFHLSTARNGTIPLFNVKRISVGRGECVCSFHANGEVVH